MARRQGRDEDRVELLDGLIVAMPPPTTSYDNAAQRILDSLAQDRLTKSAIYARAGVPCYWIVNLRDLCVEVYRDPDRWKSEYRSVTRATGTDILSIDEFPGAAFEAADFLPRPDYNSTT